MSVRILSMVESVLISHPGISCSSKSRRTSLKEGKSLMLSDGAACYVIFVC